MTAATNQNSAAAFKALLAAEISSNLPVNTAVLNGRFSIRAKWSCNARVNQIGSR
jgi:hypothetical protein